MVDNDTNGVPTKGEQLVFLTDGLVPDVNREALRIDASKATTNQLPPTFPTDSIPAPLAKKVEVGAKDKLTPENFEEKVMQSKIPVLLDFWADWCGPCVRLNPILKAAKEKYGDRFKLYKVNIDDTIHQELLTRFKIKAIPTLIIIKNQEVVAHKVGGLTSSEFDKFITPHLD